MREVFKAELENIADELVEMAAKVSEAMRSATEALENNDLELAEKVIDADTEIDNMTSDLDQRSAELLALQAPVAADLRVVISALKMSVALERMGDLARHVASLVRIRHPQPALPEGFRDVFLRMGEAAIRIGEEMEQLLDNPGLRGVPLINAIDEELDQLHLRVFTLIAESDHGVLSPAQIADITLLSRYFERFGDQAVNVSKRVEYLLTGSWVPDLSAKD
ncbi:phosphate signaling complex protein PhoU [Brevibacterium luteolum]|uniref:phosphate signaling complex protein PhoU n=1 Tax=Brevibacterium luteolum TaxID=199591 RepID=UPI003B67AD91